MISASTGPQDVQNYLDNLNSQIYKNLPVTQRSIARAFDDVSIRIHSITTQEKNQSYKTFKKILDFVFYWLEHNCVEAPSVSGERERFQASIMLLFTEAGKIVDANADKQEFQDHFTRIVKLCQQRMKDIGQ